MLKYSLFLLFPFFLFVSPPSAPDPDDTQGAWDLLETRRQQVPLGPEGALELLKLGDWETAHARLKAANREAAPLAWGLVAARWHHLNNAFFESEKLVEQLLKKAPEEEALLLLKAELMMEAWELKAAEKVLLEKLSNTARGQYLLGKIELFRKQYPQALSRAQSLQKSHPEYAKAQLLEAEAHFWQRDIKAAEAALQRCLRLDPFDADARFYYGYAIWRRVDATQLPAMAAQWELALAIHPLHYLTHWHWGNGHTQLTYADYLDPQEDEIRNALQAAEQAITANQMDLALSQIQQVKTQYPQSVIPEMYEGSAWYMAYDKGSQRLDAAQRVFEEVLEKKKNYGPAHNALAAVIKQKRFPFLAAYDSLQQVIDEIEIAAEEMQRFEQLFPDMAYYPGDRIQKMIWNQLFASRACFPFLIKQGRKFVIPPLHIDLALAMENPYFRGNTTFDNRQWMDIRGVGSGATAIEYVERGAHLERNVTLHEYVHLFHSRVLTDEEKRRVRSLYAQAMQNNLTLDYYSANNEHEYLAQTYTAYFAPVKVHPLNHKSVNTRGDLQQKDPALFAFIDSLVKRQQAYLAGDEQAMASNWARVYVNLAQSGLRMGFASDKTLAWLDTALLWDRNCLPAYVTYGKAYARRKEWGRARQKLAQALEIRPNYAPAFWALAEMSEGEETEKWYRKAFDSETDFAVKADIQEDFREFYKAEGRPADAIRLAETYAASVPTFSTYLRDRKRSALSFAYALRVARGDTTEALAFFRREATLRPQDYGLQLQYGKALRQAGRAGEALKVLEQAIGLLRAAGSASRNFSIYAALSALDTGQPGRARQLWEDSRGRKADGYAQAELLIRLGEEGPAQKALDRLSPETIAQQAQQAYLQALFAAQQGRLGEAEAACQRALELQPLHVPAAFLLLDGYVKMGKKSHARRLARSLREEEGLGEMAKAKLQNYLR